MTILKNHYKTNLKLLGIPKKSNYQFDSYTHINFDYIKTRGGEYIPMYNYGGLFYNHHNYSKCLNLNSFLLFDLQNSISNFNYYSIFQYNFS